MTKEFKYKVIKRKIKNPRLELKTGELVAVVPHEGDFDVPSFVERHYSWIKEKQRLIKKYSQKKLALRKQDLDKENLRQLIKKFIEEDAVLVSSKPQKILIKEMKSKWGSCSVKKTLTFNILMSKLPNNFIRYIVFHELCHLIYRKHDTNFKLLLQKKYNNLERMEKQLFTYWFMVSSR